MVALRLFSLLLAAVGFALPAHALVFPYEQVVQAGPNNIIDSNAESCDNSPFNAGTGVWASGGQGCYNRTGGLCSADPSHICDLQLIPKGRCTYGDLSSTGGPGGSNTCVWPHGAGRCTGNTHVGCLTDAYIANPASTGSGASQMCSGTGNNNCDMTTDPYGGVFRTACACQGTDNTLATFETTVCGTAGGAVKAVCSDGDPDRDTGGYGTALGVELNLGSGNVSFANMGPSINGDAAPTQSPPYLIENIPGSDSIEPQRGAGNANRGGAAVPIVKEKTTDARDVDPNFNATLGVSKVVNFGDSYWNDWAFVSVGVTGTFNTHIVVFSCDPPVGFKPDVKIDPTPGAPNSGDEKYCSQMGRDGVAFNWARDLTPTELSANPNCPPNCKKDFDITTTEIEQFVAAGLQDPGAGAQLAIQSGEGRQAGAGDSIGVAVVTSNTWLGTNDMRCKMGGWSNAPGFVGRCSDGPTACIPGDPTNGDSLCTAEGGSCRACNGPYDASTNPLGLPIGYNTHALPELDLVAGKRIGGIAGVASAVRVPLFVVGTTGFAASDFRDLPDASFTLDLADMGLVDTSGSPFGVGVGTGGTFTNGSTLPIGSTCCASGANVVWAPDAVGDPVTTFNRTFDRGPGADGIPGCMNDVSAISNGLNACNQRLGKGNTGAKTDGFFATGKDDQDSIYSVGSSGNVPASANRFGIRDATAAVVSHFSGAPYNYASPNPFTVNTVAAFPFRDISVFGSQNTDILVKVDTTFCPMVGLDPACTPAGCAPGTDPDGDGVCDPVDNCPTVANGPAQAGVVGVGNQTDGDADGVGDACDNCTTKPNAREAATCFTTATTTCGPWSTLTGQQRDDDHDGYGNKCDGKFPGVTTAIVGAADLAQWRASNGKSRTGDTCGTTGTRPCAIFDLDQVNGIVGAGDLAVWRTLNGKAPGPKCPTCPLTCTAGSTGTCGAIP